MRRNLMMLALASLTISEIALQSASQEVSRLVSPQVWAQKVAANNHQPRYKLIDLGTFGGPRSSVGGQSVVVTNHHTVTGGADTEVPDPYAPNCFDPTCFTEHAFRWHGGALMDLGTLPNGTSSFGYAINARDLVVGWSQNGLIDPQTGVPEYVPVAWKNDRIVEIGTFGGAFGQASADDKGDCRSIRLSKVPYRQNKFCAGEIK